MDEKAAVNLSKNYFLKNAKKICKPNKCDLNRDWIKIKNRTCYYFDEIIKIDYFDLDNILIDKTSYENILAYIISYLYVLGLIN